MSPVPPAARPRRARRRAAALLSLAAVAAAVAVPSAGAAAPSQPGHYGLAHHVGSFDADHYDAGAFDGPLTPGAFVDPEAFAVDLNDPDAPDHTAFYVLDRTSKSPDDPSMAGEPTTWRLQKLDEAGAQLGVTTFTVPGDANDTGFQPRVAQMVIDHPDGATPGRVYLMVHSGDQAQALEIIAQAFAFASSLGVAGFAGLIHRLQQ